ncbi:MAG: hypothetical protein KAH84_09055, partial [Thiomargarita sp.]|nr:hypothetical protein [Thiomargarita sp.]
MPENNPFYKPTTPKNSFELLKWLIFEPVLLGRYEKSLTKIQTLWIVFKFVMINFFVIIIPLTLVLFVIGMVIIAAFDLPLLFPPNTNQFKIFYGLWVIPVEMHTELLLEQWPINATIWEKTYFLISFNEFNALKFLLIGLLDGLLKGLA